MKKIITLITIVLFSIAANGQQKFNDGIYAKIETAEKNTDIFDLAQISYSHGVFNAVGFWECNELWFRVWRLEMSFYWDFTNYDEKRNAWSERVNDKSYVAYDTSITQYGYMGYKFGFMFDKHFSAGVVVSMGADQIYYEKEHTHLYYIGEDYTNVTISNYFGNDYTNLGLGVYGKAQINVGNVCLFASAQLCTNMDTTISIGIGWAFEVPWWF